MVSETAARRGRLFTLGIADLTKGIDHWRLSYLMGLGDIRKRYARSKIGQFWLTISTGIMVATLGFVWSTLWKMPVADLLPFIAISLIVWTLIAGAAGEAATVFVASGPIYLNQGLTFSTAVYALIFRHLLIFLHNLPIVALTMLIFAVPVGLTGLLALPGFALLLLSLLWITYLVAIACLRFRDLAQVVQSVLTIAFFITPVLWKPDQIPPDKQYFLALNPFAALMAVVREPVLGQLPTLYDWLSAALFAVGGIIISLPIIGYCQRRIIYWI